MPRLTMETDHALGAAEALKRLRDKFDSVRAQFGPHVSQLSEQWDGNTLKFAFQTLGMSVSGTVAVDEDRVRLQAELPLAAALIKGTIERRIRQELGDLLA